MNKNKVSSTRIARIFGVVHMLDTGTRGKTKYLPLLIAFTKQRQEKATQRLASFQWAYTTGHRQGGKELVQSRQYLWPSTALAGAPSSLLPRGQADAVASVAPEAVEQPVGATPWPETGIGVDLTRFATHGRAGQSRDRRCFGRRW